MSEEFESGPFEPVVILPSQTAVEAQWADETSGPIGLMLAVLEEAARCIERGRGRCRPGLRKLAAEAEAWVLNDSREWPFAFASICDVLGLEVDAARARFLTDKQPVAGEQRTRAPIWRIQRGQGRTSVCPPRPTSKAA